MEQIGRCDCGCGKATNSSNGRSRRYLPGHNRRGKGQGWLEGGYRYESVDNRKVAVHRRVVEEREGRRLRSDEIVHHVEVTL